MTIKFVKLLIPIISILSIFTIFTSLPTFAATDINACNGLDKESLAYRAAGCDNDTEDQLPKTIINILNIIIGISGIIAVIFIIIGGINYMTSSGDATKVKKAKDTILYACIGLAVCALSFAIANWAINSINDATDPNFSNNSES